MIPFKEFILFHPATLEANWTAPDMSTPADWTTEHYRYCKLGDGRKSSTVYTHFRSIYIPKDKDYELVSGLDQAARAEIDLALGLTMDTCTPAVTDSDLIHCILNDPSAPTVWNKYKVTGKHYNGQDEWNDHPPDFIVNGNYYGDIQKAQLPKLFTLTFKAHATGVGPFFNAYQEQFFRLGVCLYLSNYNPLEPADCGIGQEFSLSCELLSMRVYYFNPIVNSLSVKYAKTTGNKELILTGLGFKNTDAEINQGGPATGVWNDLVDFIYFKGLQKQGTGGFYDEFDDDARDPVWSDQPNNGTIVEAGEILNLAVANGVDGNWWISVKKAPFAMITPLSKNITVITKLNNYTVNNETNAALLIGNTLTIPNGTGGYSIIFGRSRAGAINGLEVVDVGKGTLAYIALTTLPVWLRLRVEGSGAGSTIYFDYSINGENWINLHTENDFSWTFIGLYAKNWGALNAISAPFEFFEYSYEGQPSATLDRDLGDFTVDSNSQITIPANKFPLLDKGTYEIELEKLDHGCGKNITAYAGDWRTDPNGRIYKGRRFTFLIDDAYVEKGFRSRRSPLILMDMSFKDRQGNVLEKSVAEMDVRTSNKIYEGLLLNFSTINRAVNDKAGNFKGTSMELDLSNHKKEYSQILYDYPILKNREVDIAVAQADEPESWKDPLLKMIVEDYHIKGTSFKVILKDLAQKIFNKSIPKKICTTDEYPNLSEDYIGAAMPEVLGLNVLGVGKAPGAVEAVQVSDDVYLASYRTLKSIDTVYSDYTVVGGWTVFYDHGGRTYIKLAGQEDKVITFDCKGYMFNGWNSVNGYIENPAYILLYTIAKIMEIQMSDLVCYSFDEIAALFESGAEEESGRLILQNTQRASVSMKQLLFDYGIKAFVATDGRLECGKKDISNYATNIIIFDQADLQEAADRKWNQDEAINQVKVESDYYPSADKFKSGQQDEKVDLIEEIDEVREDTIERDIEDRKGGRRARQA